MHFLIIFLVMILLGAYISLKKDNLEETICGIIGLKILMLTFGILFFIL